MHKHTWLCSNKTLFTKWFAGGRDLTCGLQFYWINTTSSFSLEIHAALLSFHVWIGLSPLLRARGGRVTQAQTKS